MKKKFPRTEKMIEQNKTSFAPITQKREMSDGKWKANSKPGPNKEKMEGQNSSRKAFAGSSDVTAGNYNQQLKMKLMDLTPRNRAKEASEGVQEFIKHVSDIIEKKNPFKETAVCSWPKGIKKNDDSPVIDSIQFNGVSKRPQAKEKEKDLDSETYSEIDVDEINKKLMRKLKYGGNLNSLQILKKESTGGRGKISRPKGSVKKKEQKDKKYQKDISTLPLRVESKAIKIVEIGKEGQDVTFPKKPPCSREAVAAAPQQNHTGRARPSEIPLRKDRMGLARKPKPLTKGKPKKETEGTASNILRSKSGRSFSPTGQDCECQELQMTINVNLSSEKISIIGEEIEPSGRLLRDNDCIKTDKCSKSPKTSDLPSNEFQEEISTTKKTSNEKCEILNLENMKTSSFTVLRNNTTVLNRLESLHKRNVLSKEKSNLGKDSLQKALTPKSSFSTLKGKTSKKNLYSRLSSKGNKPGLKMRIKKIKKEINPVTRILKQRSKSNSESPRLGREEVKVNETEDVGMPSRLPRCRKIKNYSNEYIKSHKPKKDNIQPKRVQSARGRSTTRRAATPSHKEEVEMTLRKQKEVHTELQSDNQKLELPKSIRSSKLNKAISEQNTIINNSNEKKLETVVYADSVAAVPMPPPSTTDIPNVYIRPMEQGEEEDDEDHWSSKTVIIDGNFNNESYPWVIDSEIPSERTEPGSKGNLEKHFSLAVKGTSLNIGKGQPPEGHDSPVVKKLLKIDLRAHGAGSKEEKNGETEQAEELSEENSKEELTSVKTNSSSTEIADSTEGKSQQSANGYSDLLSMEISNEPGSLSLVHQKSCSSLKRKLQSKCCGNMKGARKKKARSDAGDRSSSSASVVFSGDISLQNKSKPDAKVRSGLTKSSKREEKSDVFEDMAALKLKRRNSEPNSFRGFVWKCADSATPKDHKASVSSLTSSLRHLNTDDIDDFIFWEAVPQKTTCGWEMSLYHFKRPWSVLSCSVFRDNRESNTPGLILENLRNGGTLGGRRFAVNQNEIAAKENPFDVEPSIAQKNIDIRNWLAALNFPTLPSSSHDAFREGNFSTQTTIDGQNLSKSLASPKRRKVASNFKFSEEASKKKSEENKYRKSTKWCNEEALTDLVRRKSGGFVTCEQFLGSEQSTDRPNVTVNLCVYSKSAEESILVETSNRTAVCEPRKYKSVEITTQPELSISATIINSGAVVGDQLVGKTKTKEKPSQETPEQEGGNANRRGGNSVSSINIPLGELTSTRPEFNIWKYLFLITVFIIILHYCYLNIYMCHN